MSSNQNILKNIAQRLGITSEPVLKKAEEYLRVFNTKAGALKTLNDVAKTVLCLDLASSNQGKDFDKDTALKLSGLKKTYHNHIHTIRKILGIDRSVSIGELCVQLGCTSIRDMAEDIFNKYKSADNKIKDFDHPQYATAAIYTACKIKKVKVDKSAFVSSSHLKLAQWKEFTAELAKFAEEKGIGVPSLEMTKKKELMVNLDLLEENSYLEDKHVKTDDKDEEVEEYEVWKQRILKEAYAALGISTGQ